MTKQIEGLVGERCPYRNPDCPHCYPSEEAMRRVSKTDEGRNAVSDEMVEVASKAYWEHGTDHNREWAEAEHYGIADNCRAAIRAALEAANLCGRNPQTDSREG